MNADTISLQINSISLLTGVKSLPLFQKFQRVFRSIPFPAQSLQRHIRSCAPQYMTRKIQAAPLPTQFCLTKTH